jgi:hypothetical protein
MAFEMLSKTAFQVSYVPFPLVPSSAVFSGIMEDNLLEKFLVLRFVSTLLLSYVSSLKVCNSLTDILRCISILQVRFS